MLIVALSPHSFEPHVIAIKLFGVALASLSSGGGESSFLALTSYYSRLSLAGWSGGTGGAGLVGAGAYAFCDQCDWSSLPVQHYWPLLSYRLSCS